MVDPAIFVANHEIFTGLAEDVGLLIDPARHSHHVQIGIRGTKKP
jgi:hypothetical protein